MRSRYTAYTLDDQSYLLKTWYPASRPELDRFKQESCKWIGLTILEEHVAERSATVEFVAKYKINGRAEQMHEISNFVLEGGAWFYVDGIFVS